MIELPPPRSNLPVSLSICLVYHHLQNRCRGTRGFNCWNQTTRWKLTWCISYQKNGDFPAISPCFSWSWRVNRPTYMKFGQEKISQQITIFERESPFSKSPFWFEEWNKSSFDFFAASYWRRILILHHIKVSKARGWPHGCLEVQV